MAPPPAQFYTPPGCICIGVELLLREYFDYLWQAKREGALSNGAARKKGALVPREQAYHATSLLNLAYAPITSRRSSCIPADCLK